MMVISRVLIVAVLFLQIWSLPLTAVAQQPLDGSYFTFIDETGNQVYETAWDVNVGDQCLTANNHRYEVIRLEGNTAFVKDLGSQDLSPYQASGQSGLLRSLIAQVAEAQGGKVAIYHTHSDESYTPTDGASSIYGNGGVYKVGDAFTTALEAKGLQVIHSMNKHDPHDSHAYERSRRTATELLGQQPDALFDVHRDSLPAQYYQANIDGQDITKVQLVVGQFGPTGKQIEDYALRVKAAADQQHPGLVKGIFFAKGGDYNQDLHPRSLLLEVGSDSNTRPEAERGIALFADIVPTVLGATAGNPGNTAGTTGLGTAGSGLSGAAKSIGWIVGIFIVGLAAYFFLGTKDMHEAGAKLKQFGKTEFANYFGPKPKKDNHQPSKPSDDDNNQA